MTRIGLVLAGGGITGSAFHSGALAALHETTGWDPRDAEVIVGTSAGSMTGALLRLGVPPSDLLARVEGREPTSATRALFARAGISRPPPIPRFAPPGIVDPRALARAVAARSSSRRRALVIAAIPEGKVEFPIVEGDGFDRLFDRFPDGLWITAVRVSDGELVVFGRDDVDATVTEAVMASSAIPGFFVPAEVGGARYVDGGLRSMANADLVRDLDLDAVVVSSPMTFTPIAPGPVGRALAGPLRQHLQSELRTLRRSGLPVLVLEPDVGLRRVMGVNPMDARRRADTATGARKAVARNLAAIDLSPFGLEASS